VLLPVDLQDDPDSMRQQQEIHALNAESTIARRTPAIEGRASELDQDRRRPCA